MILYPNCKLNIGLAVTHKRADGYHDLDTIFYPVYGLHDELEVTVADGASPDDLTFVQEGIAVDCAAEDNLIVRCYRLMQATFPGRIGAVRVRFRKNIPFGAGLGGGSADATFMARALNELFSIGLSETELAALVKPLGADCPFFAYNRPCHATGIGDVLEPIEFDTFAGKRLILIKPETYVSTREAYGGIVPRDQWTDAERERLEDKWVNDFEHTVFLHHPELAEIKQILLAAGAIYAAMSGSGSTIFGFFEPEMEVVLPSEIAKCVIFDDLAK